MTINNLLQQKQTSNNKLQQKMSSSDEYHQNASKNEKKCQQSVKTDNLLKNRQANKNGIVTQVKCTDKQSVEMKI